uniref:Venom S1 protease 32 n=1 Tax=Platymeris rhadamanthus TaxID=1134088 RepID=A0A6B9L3Y0_PLARH|nr:venom S1 protease 32 [Platymeris rhadamanthus]
MAFKIFNLFLLICINNIIFVWCADIRDYMNAPDIDIDSSEYGMHPGKVKTNCRCGWSNKNTKRIVGGTETGVNEYPLVAGLANGQYGYMICGASIITAYHGLTAAHCTIKEKGNPLAIIVGEHDVMRTDDTDATRMHQVKTVIEHEKYEQVNQQYDISLLVLEIKIEFSQKVGPACLPTSQRNLVDEVVKVLGWGKLRSKGKRPKTLQGVNLRVIPLEICAKTFAAEVPTSNPHQLCTFNYRKDACQGDSGGPLIWVDPDTNMYTQVGIISYGSGCGSDSPGISTDLAFFTSWIQQKIAETNPEAGVCKKM